MIRGYRLLASRTAQGNPRIVTAIFLKETLANAANDAELQIDESKRTSQMYQSKLQDLFHTMDGDDSGSVSYQEFIEHLDHPIIKRYMALLDIHVHDVKNLFDILDDGDGKITVQAFRQHVVLSSDTFGIDVGYSYQGKISPETS